MQARDRAVALEAAAATEAALVECNRAAEERIMAEKEFATKALDEQAAEMDALRRLLKLRQHELQALRAKLGRQVLKEIASSSPLLKQLPGHSLHSA